MFRDLVLRNRSYRRFDQGVAIERSTLEELVDLARCSASAANRQPLKYILSVDAERNAVIFSTLAWAGYLKDWGGPAEGERPSAYIVILLDRDVSANAGCDHGIAAQTILLGACERGLGGCMLGAIQRDDLRKLLKIPVRYDILLVVALGQPVEVVALEEMPTDGDIKYYRTSDMVHHVPKRALRDIILDL
ncbi:MAG: nitroreductase family protein [Chloroflexi bacterium]|nr:nitroreductase family protein [Chloroflexota bacterium]